MAWTIFLLSLLATARGHSSTEDEDEARFPRLKSSLPPKCAWCTGGACNPTCAKVKSLLDTGYVTAKTNRSFPYWHAPSQKPLGVADAAIEIGVIIHHGSARNGDDYFCSMWNGLRKRFGVAVDTVLLVAPQVYEARDKPANDELFWDGRGGGNPDRDWAWGGNSSASLAASLSSFSTLDQIVSTMMNATLHPNLKAVYVAGHSAGGQIVQRYALASSVEPARAGVRIRYFPANPSSYTYLSAARPVQLSPWTCDGFCDNATLLTRNWSFATPAAGSVAVCPGYDKYGYGLSGHLPPYLASRGVPAMLEAYGRRSVTYLSGSSDVCDTPFMRQHSCTPGCDPYDGGLDTSCGAYLQGKCRMHRAHAFAEYVRGVYAGVSIDHRLVAIAHVGHSGCAVYQSPEALSAMFPHDLAAPISRRRPRSVS